MDWLATSIAMALSACLLLVNVYPALNEHAPASSKVLAAALAGSQVTFGLTMKLFFFRKI